MKSFLLYSIVVLLFCVSFSGQEKKHNKIDGLNTVEEVQQFINSVFKGQYESKFYVRKEILFKDATCDELVKSVKAVPWVKADFDNNGLTDLLVYGNYYGHAVWVVMDMGRIFTIKYLTRKVFQNCIVPTISSIAGREIVLNNFFLSQKITDFPDTKSFLDAKPIFVEQKLIYEYGDFVEYNQTPSNHVIEKIEYQTSGCFGSCPIFNIVINSDRKAIFKPIRYNTKDGGEHKARIKEKDFSELTGLLNYIDFPSLKDNYSVRWTDDQSCRLTITYDGGKVKKIRDYGLIGTFGLNRVYMMLFDFRKNQIWR